jgi:hypothetical protein
MFKTSQANIAQIKATITAYGECWFHGCGNIYVGKSESDFRKDFTNPNSEESVYRVHFTNAGQVPSNVEDLNKLLMQSRNQEMIQEKIPKHVSSVKTISVPRTDNNVDDEAELQRMIEQEKKGKAGK